MRFYALLSSFFVFTGVFAQLDGNTTPTYPELIEMYRKLANDHDEIELYEMGQSDYGLPIYLCVINGAGDSTNTFEKARNETTVLINNGIHPGEPDGINACLIWIGNWIKSGKKTKNLPVVATIPAYNVGGMMNRSGTSRANQKGPEEYGFRGNAQNLDLNRDFIKMDSRNMWTFATIYHALDPDVFADTHVSNGADYQYTLTYIASIQDRMAPPLAKLIYERMIPEMGEALKKRDCEWIPYVYVMKETPDSGLIAFNDLPRYSMGYTSLFHSISFTVETHMLKPFEARIQATLTFLEECISWTEKEAEAIEKARVEAFEYDANSSDFYSNYKLDSDLRDSILFKGYEHSYPISSVTGLPRLEYDSSKPWEKYIPFYQHYTPTDTSAIPAVFIVGQQCTEVLDRLRVNGVEMTRVEQTEVVGLEQYRVISFETWKNPYEGHVGHSNVKVENARALSYSLKAGDFLIPTDQRARRLILSVLYPPAPDSYFNWGFLDSYVQQKEHFSSYVFEDIAEEILKSNPEIRHMLEEKRNADPEFAKNSWAQLDFIYKNSSYYEPTHNRLPILIGY